MSVRYVEKFDPRDGELWWGLEILELPTNSSLNQRKEEWIQGNRDLFLYFRASQCLCHHQCILEFAPQTTTHTHTYTNTI